MAVHTNILILGVANDLQTVITGTAMVGRIISKNVKKAFYLENPYGILGFIFLSLWSLP